MQRFRQSSIILLLTMALLGLGSLLIAQWLRPDRSPRIWTGGNILANADWQSAADNGIPDGWSGNGIKRADTTNGYVLDDQYSLQLYGVNSFARSPRLTAQAGQRYRLGFQALIDPGTQRSSLGAQFRFGCIGSILLAMIFGSISKLQFCWASIAKAQQPGLQCWLKLNPAPIKPLG